jgi:hypothetical protein
MQEFLVALGFKVDNAGMERFQKTLQVTHKVVKDFVLTLSGLAVTMEEATRRTAKQFEGLFFLAQSTGVAAEKLKSVGFAFEQIGLSAGSFQEAVAGLAATIRENPALRTFTEQLTGQAYKGPQEALDQLADRYAKLLAMGRAGEWQLANYIKQLGLLGVSPQMIDRLARNRKELQQW